MNHRELKSNTLSVVFSFRNEEDVLPELIARTRKVLTQEQEQGMISSYELIFVNDASTDRSLEVLLEHSKGHQDIKIVTMSRCFGPSPCVMAGMEYSSGDVVVYMDADLQDPPEVIHELLAMWKKKKDIDVVHTIRLSRKGESKIKLFITKIGYYVLNKFSSIYLPVEAGDFKLLSRRVVDHLVSMREVQPFVRGLVCWIGFKQDYVYYNRESRFAGKTKFHVFSLKVINNFFGSALISFSSAPLKVASFLGLFAILVDFVLMGYALFEKMAGKAISQGTTLMIVVLFLGGIQLFCVGIMGLYLNSVYEQGKKRPNYIVDQTFGFPQDAARKNI
jgi:dolichol-phosphate mannosyltransferase